MGPTTIELLDTLTEVNQLTHRGKSGFAVITRSRDMTTIAFLKILYLEISLRGTLALAGQSPEIIIANESQTAVQGSIKP